MSLMEAVLGSAFAVLERPRWLLLALAGFLARGGIVVLLIPLVQVPTLAALANLLGPALVGFVFGGVSLGFLVLIGTAVASLAAGLVLGGLAGAAVDLGLVREAAATEDLEGVPGPDRGGPGRAVVVRWLAHLPTLIVIVAGASPLVDAVYQELIHPGDPGVPIFGRIVLRVPAVVGGLLVAWAFGEIIGGLAVRHLAWGSGAVASLARAVASLARPSGLALAVLSEALLVGAVAVGWIALAFSFDGVRVLVRDAAEPWFVALGMVLLSVAWLAALWLLAVAAAWRSTAWTFEVARHLPDGTIVHAGG